MTKRIAPTSTNESCHKNVKDMVRDLLADDVEFVSQFETRLASRQMVKSLAVVRARAGLSQQELAVKMGCTQSKISKVESGVDADLKFGDIEAYLKATDHEAKIFLTPGGGTIADDVKLHALQIHRLLAKMVAMVGTDHDITEGVAAFIDEAASNLTRMTRMAAKALPKFVSESNPTVQVETPEPEDRSETEASEQAPRQKTPSASKSKPRFTKQTTGC